MFQTVCSWLCWGECYQRMALILFYCFKIEHYRKWSPITELFIWCFCVKLKILHMPSSSPFWMVFSFSVVFGIRMRNVCSWLGSCPKWAPWWSGIKRSGVETSSPSLWHCWAIEGANTSSAELVATFRASEKGWVNVSVLKIKIRHMMEKLINISLVVSVLICSWCLSDVWCALCRDSLTDQCWVVIIPSL